MRIYLSDVGAILIESAIYLLIGIGLQTLFEGMIEHPIGHWWQWWFGVALAIVTARLIFGK